MSTSGPEFGHRHVLLALEISADCELARALRDDLRTALAILPV